MDVTESSSFGPGAPARVAPPLDPRLKPTPDYGTLGPGSDIGSFGSDQTRASTAKPSPRFVQLIAIMIGMFGAIVAGTIGSAHSAWSDFFSGHQSRPATSKDLGQIDRMKPQKQAETLLELAVGHSAGAVDQISSRVDRWQGKVQWNSQIATLSTAALNSNDMRVRESGVEVELAAYGLAKNSASVEYLSKTADSPNHAQKIWALWALGLMANRGVETEQVVNVLTSHLKDSDADSRRWAVEALALTANDQAIEPLLTTMHDDASPLVRERAACSLAVSGLFTPQQRFTAVPQLLNYSDDAALDAQTHGWAFQALGDITHQRLPNDSGAWRNWYNSSRND
jgi:hypothetical protein